MAGVKDLKKKIKSTKGTHKITSAMKLVSAAKLARAQSAIQGARPYAGELEKR
nr:F0F1 ATP synthase subunit gamma [Bacteriovoracaceae bacterium]